MKKLDFYKSTPLEHWNCENIVEHYRKEKQHESKVLDSVKKDLKKVAHSDSDFDVDRRKKGTKYY
jgi:hypothetical protein